MRWSLNANMGRFRVFPLTKGNLGAARKGPVTRRGRTITLNRRRESLDEKPPRLSAQPVMAKKQVDFDIPAKGNVAAAELSSLPALGVAKTFGRIHQLGFFLFIGGPLCIVVAGVGLELIGNSPLRRPRALRLEVGFGNGPGAEGLDALLIKIVEAAPNLRGIAADKPRVQQPEGLMPLEGGAITLELGDFNVEIKP